MHHYWKILWVLGWLSIPIASHAETVSINALQYSSTPKHNRLQFDVSTLPKHKVFFLDNPTRLVIDLSDAQLEQPLTHPSAEHPLFKSVRNGIKDKTGLRIVFDLKTPISAKQLALNIHKSDKHHLIVDLYNKSPIAIVAATEPAPAPKPVRGGATAEQDPLNQVISSITSTSAKKSNRIVVAIDPGHGGNDAGARGPQGTQEKLVTFAIAKKLAALINGQAGMKALMVRKGDYYVGLRERMKIAREAKADLFISIHADAFQDLSVKGASVYTLSTSGASSEAAHWLADSENASDLVGVSLNDKEEVLASVLLDLSQTATQEASVNVANQVLKSFANVAQLHKDSVQKAGFIVLKSPDVPSILVETAFISNPSEEQNLINSQYQNKMATAIFKGVRNYFKQTAPADDKFAALD